METQIKERLTGAIILVALVVLLVPELLTGPGRSAPVAAKRADEAPMRSYTVNLADGSAAQRAAPAPVAVGKKDLAPVRTEVESLEAKVVSKEPPREAAPVMGSEETAETVPAPVPARPMPQLQRAATPEPVSGPGWAIQLGSFQSRENAQRLVKELKGKGFNAFILDGGGKSGKLYRVRVGPAADRAAAAALAAKLRQNGQPGSIVPYP